MRLPSADRSVLVALCTAALWIALPYAGNRWIEAHMLSRFAWYLFPLLAAAVIWALRRSPSNSAVKDLLNAWFHTSWSYCLVVTLSAILLLIGCSAVGYLPYSDRPGPGWHNIQAHWPVLEEIKYFSSWGLLLLPMCYFMAMLLFLFMAWIRWLKAPAWLVRVLGGLFCSVISILAVAAAGWYIAISVFVTNSVGVCALLFGVFVLPRISPQREMHLPLAIRVVGITLAALAMSAFVAYPFIR